MQTENITRTINDKDFEMILEHFRLFFINHRNITDRFREHTEDEILTFILRHTEWKNDHFMAIKDDAVTISKIFKEQNILRPIL